MDKMKVNIEKLLPFSEINPKTFHYSSDSSDFSFSLTSTRKI